MDILVEAKYIPDGATVYKKTGQAKFIFRHNLKLFTYGENSSQFKEILGTTSTKVLCMIDERGNINLVDGDVILRVPLEQGDDCEADPGDLVYNGGILPDILHAKYGLEAFLQYEEVPQ